MPMTMLSMARPIATPMTTPRPIFRESFVPMASPSRAKPGSRNRRAYTPGGGLPIAQPISLTWMVLPSFADLNAASASVSATSPSWPLGEALAWEFTAAMKLAISLA